MALWISVNLFLGLQAVAAVSAVPGHIQTPTPSPAAGPAPALTLEQQEQIDRYVEWLTRTDSGVNDRLNGAIELLERGWPQAIDALWEILNRGNDIDAKTAICMAIARVRQPPERLIEPLVKLLTSESDGARSAASAALAAYSNSDVAYRLGELAGNGAASMPARLAAIAALKMNVYDRSAVTELMGLLKNGDAQIRSEALAALKLASRADFGENVEQWEQWWAEKRSLTAEEWLDDRNKLLQARIRQLDRDLTTQLNDQRRENEQLAQKLGESLTRVYHLSAEPQGDELLTKWLDDPLTVVRRSAIGIISGLISDGKLPSDVLQAKIRQKIGDPSPEVRNGVLAIIQALGDPGDADVILDVLPLENDPSVRLTMLRVLGWLGNPSAIEPLIAELTESDPQSVVQAALALGALAISGSVPAETLEPAAEPLMEQYTRFEEAASPHLPTLLSAMADIANPRFLPTFAEAVDRSNPDLQASAIRGIIALNSREYTEPIAKLVASPDPRVRREAVVAIGRLGDAGHLESLYNRISPASEPNPFVREAAWNGFEKILAGQPFDVRLTYATRFNGDPERCIRLLSSLEKDLSTTSPASLQLATVQRQLAAQHSAQHNDAEAASLLLKADRILLDAQSPDEPEVLGKLVTALLKAQRHEQAVQLARERLSANSDAVRQQVEGAVLNYFLSLSPEQRQKLLALMRPKLFDVLSEQTRRGIESPVNASTPTTQPTTSQPLPGP